MIKELINLANHLDSKGYAKEASYLDNIIKRAGPGTAAMKALAPELTQEEQQMKEGITYFVDSMLSQGGEKISQLYSELLDLPDSHLMSGMVVDDGQLEEYPEGEGVSLPQD